MGFTDWVKKTYLPSTVVVDYVADISAQRPTTDPVEAVMQVMFLSAKSQIRGSNGLTSVMNNAVENTIRSAVSSKHVRGDAGSIAKTMPREYNLAVIAMGAERFTVWNHGLTGQDAPGELIFDTPRANIASIERTTVASAREFGTMTVTFTDGSAIDFRSLARPEDNTFWNLAEVSN